MQIKFPILLLFISFISCSTDNESSQNNNNDNDNTIDLKLKEFIYTDMTNSGTNDYTMHFIYDTNDRFVQSIAESESGTYVSDFIYTNNNITRIEYSNESYRELVYENGLIKSVSHINGGFVHNYTYEYDNNLNMIYSADYNGENLLCEDNYQYDFNGNHIYWVSECRQSIFDIEYDTKKNPFSLVFPEVYMKHLPMGKNNQTKITTLFLASGTTVVDSIVYNYNSYDYPIDRSFYIDGILKAMEEYIYE